MEKLTLDVVKKMFPKNVAKKATQEIVDLINEVTDNPDHAQFIRDNILTYTSVLQDGRYKIKDYILATKYVSYKMMEDTNIAAYSKTFPERMQRMIDKGMPDKDINSVITAYNKGSVVTKIFEKIIVPTSITYRDLFHQSILKQADLMMNANSEAVQQKASAHLIEHLKPNEEAKIELDVNLKESVDIVAQYDKALTLASEKMLNLIEKGANIEDVANIRLTVKEEISDAEVE